MFWLDIGQADRTKDWVGSFDFRAGTGMFDAGTCWVMQQVKRNPCGNINSVGLSSLWKRTANKAFKCRPRCTVSETLSEVLLFHGKRFITTQLWDLFRNVDGPTAIIVYMMNRSLNGFRRFSVFGKRWHLTRYARCSIRNKPPLLFLIKRIWD